MKRGKIFSESQSLEEKRDLGMEAGGTELMYTPELEETTGEDDFMTDDLATEDDFTLGEDLFDPLSEEEIFQSLNQEVDVAKIVSRYFSSRNTYHRTVRNNKPGA